MSILQLAVGEGTFQLYVPNLKSLDNLISVEANLDNATEMVEKPVITIKPLTYETNNLTCSYYIHFKNSETAPTSVKLKLSVFYRDNVIDNTGDSNFAFVNKENQFTEPNIFSNTVTIMLEPTNDTDGVNKKYVTDNFTSKEDELALHDDLYDNFLKKTANEPQTVEPQVDFLKVPTINGVPITNSVADNLITKDNLDSVLTQNGYSPIYVMVKEIEIDKSTITQTLMGSFYYYTWNYDISHWDNGEWSLEGVTFKNIHIENMYSDTAKSGEVNSIIQKAITSICFDENKLYGTILTPNMLSYGSTDWVKAELTCSYKKAV